MSWIKRTVRIISTSWLNMSLPPTIYSTEIGLPFRTSGRPPFLSFDCSTQGTKPSKVGITEKGRLMSDFFSEIWIPETSVTGTRGILFWYLAVQVTNPDIKAVGVNALVSNVAFNHFSQTRRLVKLLEKFSLPSEASCLMEEANPDCCVMYSKRQGDIMVNTSPDGRYKHQPYFFVCPINSSNEHFFLSLCLSFSSLFLSFSRLYIFLIRLCLLFTCCIFLLCLCFVTLLFSYYIFLFMFVLYFYAN